MTLFSKYLTRSIYRQIHPCRTHLEFRTTQSGITTTGTGKGSWPDVPVLQSGLTYVGSSPEVSVVHPPSDQA